MAAASVATGQVIGILQRFAGPHFAVCALMDNQRRIDGFVLVAVAFAAGPTLALSPWPAAVGALLVGVLCQRAATPLSLLLAVLAFGVGGVRSSLGLERAARAHARTVRVLPAPNRCDVEGTVVRSPVLRRASAHQRSSLWGAAQIDLDIRRGECGDPLDGPPRPIGSMRVRLYGAPEHLGRGDHLRLVVDLAAVDLWRNPEQPNPWPRLALNEVTASGTVVDVSELQPSSGLLARIDQFRAHARRRIEASYSEEMAPYARALVLGETDLGHADRQAFRDSGLAHLLAVSGTHLILAVLALASLLRALLLRWSWLAGRIDVGRISAAVCVVAAWLYADFAGGGGSAYRAAAMMSIAMLARSAGRRPLASRCFAWSLLIGAAVEPLAMCELSFSLSVGATAGLLAVQSLTRAQSRGWLGRLAAAQLSTAAAMLGCAPVLLMVGPKLPLLGVAANVIAAPIGELAALPLCLAHSLLWWSPAAEHGAALLASGALLAVRAVAWSAAESAYGQLVLPLPTPWQFLVVLLAVLSSWRRAGRARLLRIGLAALLLLGFELVANQQGAPRDLLRVSVLDVAQGDGILVDLPDGRLMLIDAGGVVGSPVDPGQRVLLPVLRARRRRRIDVVVLTHPHPDHYGGLLSMLPELEIGELWISGAVGQDPTSPLGPLLARLRDRGVVFRGTEELCANARHFGQARVELLAPCPSHDPEQNINDSSLVLRLSMGKRVALLMGDAELASERALLARKRDLLRADLLKVGHHGSATSSSRSFVAAVSPAVAVVSCGVRNRFGHPHPNTLDTFASAGSTLLRTDRGGAVVWQTDGEQVCWRRGNAPPPDSFRAKLDAAWPFDQAGGLLHGSGCIR